MREFRWPPIYGTVILAMFAVFLIPLWALWGGGEWGDLWIFEGLIAAIYVLAVLVAQLGRN